jgi:hypothetical protein
MFYIKTRLNDSIELKVDLYDDEIFTACPSCGKEMQFEPKEIAEILADDGEFASTVVYCSSCSKKKQDIPNNKLVVITNGTNKNS